MTRILVSTLVAAVIAGGVAWFIVSRRRRKADVPELNRHPERLEQMLDETDDA